MANPNPSPKTRFKDGRSGNPGGFYRETGCSPAGADPHRHRDPRTGRQRPTGRAGFGGGKCGQRRISQHRCRGRSEPQCRLRFWRLKPAASRDSRPVSSVEQEERRRESAALGGEPEIHPRWHCRRRSHPEASRSQAPRRLLH